MADRERNEYLKAMESRHSVRRYKDQPLTEEVKATLMREVKEVLKKADSISDL